MAVNDELLINLVRENVCLYDKSRKEYHDKILKNNTWDRIADQLKQDVEKIKRRWQTLRDSYVRSKKEGKGKSGDAGGTKKKWIYEEQMNFLKEHIIQRETISNWKSLALDPDESISNENAESLLARIQNPVIEIEEGYDDDDDVNDDDINEHIVTTNQISQANKRKKTNPIDDYFNCSKKFINQEMERRRVEKKECEDESSLFAKSIVPRLRKLNDATRGQAFLEIWKLIIDLEKNPIE